MLIAVLIISVVVLVATLANNAVVVSMSNRLLEMEIKLEEVDERLSGPQIGE